jgi:hypothetical protein
MEKDNHRGQQGSQTAGETPQGPSDQLNARIGVLNRREVEARILGPLIDQLGLAFDPDKVLEVVRETIIRIGGEQGEQLARTMGGNSMGHFAESLKYWTQDEALEIQVLEQTDERFIFNVTRCRYAELYRSLGIPDLGRLLSCNRDFALIRGFNGRITLDRTKTIMEGADCCDFRYRLKKDETGEV